MKNLFKTLILLLALQASSCSENLLDVPNPNTLTADEFWVSEEDAYKLLEADV